MISGYELRKIIKILFHPLYLKLPVEISGIATLIFLAVLLIRPPGLLKNNTINSDSEKNMPVDLVKKSKDTVIESADLYSVQAKAEIQPVQKKEIKKPAKARKQIIEKSVTYDINLLITGKSKREDSIAGIRQITTEANGQVIDERRSKDTELAMLVVSKIPTESHKSFLRKLHGIGMFREKEISSNEKYKNVIIKIYILF